MTQCDFCLLDLENYRKVTNLLSFPGQSFNSKFRQYNADKVEDGGGGGGDDVGLKGKRRAVTWLRPQETAFYGTALYKSAAKVTPAFTEIAWSAPTAKPLN